MSDSNGYHVCTKCNQSLTTDQFHRNATKKIGINSICKECSNALARHRYESRKLSGQEVETTTNHETQNVSEASGELPLQANAF